MLGRVWSVAFTILAVLCMVYVVLMHDGDDYDGDGTPDAEDITPNGGSNPDDASHFVYYLPDGREITCIRWDDGDAGGISCDWNIG